MFNPTMPGRSGVLHLQEIGATHSPKPLQPKVRHGTKSGLLIRELRPSDLCNRNAELTYLGLQKKCERSILE
jgi:hypothetical protein